MPTATGRRKESKRQSAKTGAKPRAQDGAIANGCPAPAAEASAQAAGDTRWLVVRGARQNNLRNVDAAFPLGRFVCVTGVSGSGKSSLVNEILYAALARDLNGAQTLPGAHDRIEGVEHLDKIIAIDQTPIGRTPRSNPATYIKLFDEIRTLFTKLPDAQVRGYKPGRFSFNVPAGPRGGGRCEACEGNGANKLEMEFLADVWVTCPICEGRRFQRETLQIHYKGKSISDVLDMDVAEALEHFANVPRIAAMLQTLHDVGLDYIKLGQASPTVSGGEAQRIKLARELVKKPTGRTLYVLDEPTTGLHFEDIRRLLTVLHGFVDAGNTVVVIEHNLDVIKTADWIIDMGPEGGERGGAVVATGTPEALTQVTASHTGVALQTELERSRKAGESRGRSAGRSGRIPSTSDGAAAIRRDAGITVYGARQNNLKDVSVTIPRDRMTICTGMSGSGKSSFAIDTVFTEGYRRYVESLSAYARQFLGQLQKPAVDRVEGLSPAICIEQKSASKSPRSTVGTVTEVFDYLRVLWARLGTPHCPRCQQPMGSQTIDEMVDRVMGLDPGTPIMVLGPVRPGDGESYPALFNRLRNAGYMRVRIDGDVRRTDQSVTIDGRRKHRMEVVVDRTVVKAGARPRIAEAVEHALTLGDGLMRLAIEEVELHEQDEISGTTHSKHHPAQELLFSQRFACLPCGESYEELTPHSYSFNSALGWCETCEGLGVQRGAPQAAIIQRPNRSLFDGALAGWGRIERASPLGRLLARLCERLGADVDAPLLDWSPEHLRVLMFGTTGDWIEQNDGPLAGVRFHWRGFFPAIDNATRNNWELRFRLSNVVTDIPCTACRGGRLQPLPAATRLDGRTIVDVCDLPLSETLAFFENLRLSETDRRIAGELLQEVNNRLRFLVDVGLDYLTLHRAAPTLSGGEAQRIRLASQIGSRLSGVLYVLDEPTIGLHPRDTNRLIHALHQLRDLGNTLLVVEHDRDVIRGADRVIDFGPRAGRLGGELVAQGTPADLAATPTRRRGTKNDAPPSLTRDYLSGAARVEIPANRRPVDPQSAHLALEEQPSQTQERRRRAPQRKPVRGGESRHALPDGPPPGWLVVRGARQHNLRGIDVPIPLGRLVAVTGVSGSGKSSLVNDILWPALARRYQNSDQTVGAHDVVTGIEHLDKVINCDQAPLGATPSSNPATYTGAFDAIRELFTRLPEAKMRGYELKRFSFNRPGGRCEACEGYGRKRIEMHFMPDVWVTCEVCNGRRYTPETLEVKFRGRSIADVLEMRIVDALDLFANIPKVRRILQTLVDVGLDYLELGQSATTLSGGEAQRVKLAAELSKPDTGRTLYILDEPTTGLHFEDVRRLLEVLHRLVDLGNSVVVVEHNLDVLKSADWIIDLGPEAGVGGGRLVAQGPPEDVAEMPDSHTGAALRPLLDSEPRTTRKRFDPAEHARELLTVQRGGFGNVGKEVRLPWQVDGRRWHLEQRDNRDGKPRRWEPQALEYVVSEIEKLKGFEPTNWNNRASVEVTASGAPTWFLHALTGGEWLLELYFRSPPGAFDRQKLNADLRLPTLDDRDDLQAYGNEPRVDVRRRQDGPDAIVIYVHDRKEIDTPAFRKFLKRAAKTYLSMKG